MPDTLCSLANLGHKGRIKEVSSKSITVVYGNGNERTFPKSAIVRPIINGKGEIEFAKERLPPKRGHKVTFNDEHVCTAEPKSLEVLLKPYRYVRRSGNEPGASALSAPVPPPKYQTLWMGYNPLKLDLSKYPVWDNGLQARLFQQYDPYLRRWTTVQCIAWEEVTPPTQE